MYLPTVSAKPELTGRDNTKITKEQKWDLEGTRRTHTRKALEVNETKEGLIAKCLQHPHTPTQEGSCSLHVIVRCALEHHHRRRACERGPLPAQSQQSFIPNSRSFFHVYSRCSTVPQVFTCNPWWKSAKAPSGNGNQSHHKCYQNQNHICCLKS